MHRSGFKIPSCARDFENASEVVQMQKRPFKIKAVLVHFECIRNLPELDTVAEFLQSKNLKFGLLSDKDKKSLSAEFKKYKSIHSSDFDTMITADDLQSPKGSRNAITQAAQTWKLEPQRILLVSARPDDIRLGLEKGAEAVFWSTLEDSRRKRVPCDYVASTPEALISIIRMGVPLPTGKLPNDLLQEFLNECHFEDPALLINPGVGEDIAAVDVDAEQVLVLKSDPITFATDAIGQYAVLINANDIATSGATPRWLLTTLLFPYGVTPSEIQHVVNELNEFCMRCKITLCGGHTEITDAVSRPVVIGMMAGSVLKSDLIDKRNVKTGDRVLVTKGVAVEGTAIIAREFSERLKGLGMQDAEIERCQAFLAHLSIIPEAAIAARFKETSAMHDVTEGGLSTALQELSIAGGHRIRIHPEAIPVFPETREICRLLGIDPMGLIGSGSLLICCRANAYQNLMTSIKNAGIEVACIGEVQGKGRGIEAYKNKKQVPWPHFEVDEITKLF
jgi:hydrogenase maturation factor/phosphoglycolate phosphatase-like HAD superfamily hydrolase